MGAEALVQILAANLGRAPLVGAWSTYRCEDGPSWRLEVFSVAGGQLELLGTLTLGDAERAAADARLAASGAQPGARDPHFPLVWQADRERFVLWSKEGKLAEVSAGELHLGEGRTPVADIETVESFLDSSWVHRGVQLVLRNGSRVVVARDEDPAPLADPTYNRDNLAIDAAWAEFLGAALAKFLGVPHVNQIS
jgi:hypothetical protein